MTAVLTDDGRVIPAQQALADRLMDVRCPVCRELVRVRKVRSGKLTLAHFSGRVCVTDEAAARAAQVAGRAAAVLEQSWSLSVSRENEYGTLEAELVGVERVAPLQHPLCTAPLVAVQLMNFACLVGLVKEKAHLDALNRLAQETGAPVLAVPVTGFEWAVLREKLLSTTPSSVWLTPVPEQRATSKRGDFNRLVSSLGGKGQVAESRKLPLPDPVAAQSRLHYMQDVLSVMRSQRWLLTHKRLVLGRKFGLDWTTWLDAYPVQAPLFWVRFWVVRALRESQGQPVELAQLAAEMAALWDAHADQEVLDAALVAVKAEAAGLEKRGYSVLLHDTMLPGNLFPGVPK